MYVKARQLVESHVGHLQSLTILVNQLNCLCQSTRTQSAAARISAHNLISSINEPQSFGCMYEKDLT